MSGALILLLVYITSALLLTPPFPPPWNIVLVFLYLLAKQYETTARRTDAACFCWNKFGVHFFFCKVKYTST